MVKDSSASLKELIELSEIYAGLFSDSTKLSKKDIDAKVKEITEKEGAERHQHELAFLLAKKKHQPELIEGLEAKINKQIETDWDEKVKIVEHIQKAFSGARPDKPAKGDPTPYLGALIVLAYEGVDAYKAAWKKFKENGTSDIWDYHINGFIGAYGNGLATALGQMGIEVKDAGDVINKLKDLIKGGQITDKAQTKLWQILINGMKIGHVSGADSDIVKNLLGEDQARINKLKRYIVNSSDFTSLYKDLELDEAELAKVDVLKLVNPYLDRQYGEIYKIVNKKLKSVIDEKAIQETYNA